MGKVFKVIYETDTGEVLPQCPLCGIYSFQSEEMADWYFKRLDIPNRSMGDITFEEKTALSTYDPDLKKSSHKVNIGMMKEKLSDREVVDSKTSFSNRAEEAKLMLVKFAKPILNFIARANAWLSTKTTDDLAESASRIFMDPVERAKLSNIESFAAADQSDAEIEAAYNNQVPKATQLEMEAGSETEVRRMSPADIIFSVLANASGGGANVIFDTKANIRLEDPDIGKLAIGLDNGRIYFATGTNWLESPTVFKALLTTP